MNERKNLISVFACRNFSELLYVPSTSQAVFRLCRVHHKGAGGKRKNQPKSDKMQRHISSMYHSQRDSVQLLRFLCIQITYQMVFSELEEALVLTFEKKNL